MLYEVITRVEEHTPAAMVPMLEDVGYSAELAHLMAELVESLNRVQLTFEHPERVLRGRTTLDEVLGGLLRAMRALPSQPQGTLGAP